MKVFLTTLAVCPSDFRLIFKMKQRDLKGLEIVKI